MSKKLLCTILSVLTSVALATSFVACTGNGNPNTTENDSQSAGNGNQSAEESVYRITFVSNGGGAVETIEKKAGEEITEPAVPVKEGYVFGGWYESPDGGSTYADKPFVFAFMPARSLTLYAKWSEQIVLYTITFESNGGSIVNAIEAGAGEKIEEPADPTKDGYLFDGWYESSDNGATLDDKPFVFGYMPSQSVKLYAKWVRQSVAGKIYKQSDTRINWKSDAEKALFAYNSPATEEDAIKAWETYQFEFTFVDDERVTVSFFNKGTRTYHLYYEIAADNTIKFYENAEAKVAGTIYRDLPILNNPFRVSNDRSEVIGIFELGIDLSDGSSLIVELNVICTVNGK